MEPHDLLQPLALNELEKEFAATYDFPTDTEVKNDTELTSIDFKQEYKWPDNPDKRFRSQDVEQLLDQAADYLNRALTDRQLWYELSDMAFKLYFEHQTFINSYELTERQITKGLLDLEINDNRAENISYSNLVTGLIDYQKFIENMIRESFDDAGNFGTGNQSRLTYISELMGQISSGFSGGTREKTGSMVAADALTVQRNALLAQFKAASAQQSQAEPRRDLARDKDDFHVSNKGFRMDSREKERKLENLRCLQALISSSALNLKDRMTALRERYLADFALARIRLHVASMGLKKVYGYDDSLPSVAEPQFFDKCLLWSRRAISHVVSIARFDQTTVISVSLKSQQGWNVGLNDGMWTFDLATEREHISDHQFPRLRGISVSVLAKMRAYDIWAGSIEPIGQTGACCYLGKITSITDNREPLIRGDVQLYNLNPFAKWRVTISKSSLSGKALNSDVDDVWIDFHVVANIVGANKTLGG